ncbi:MAG: thermonuclease family protein [Hydrogenophilales bacterium]|nr:thermonuclease family protein [Hydrogenophilales bacterium]
MLLFLSLPAFAAKGTIAGHCRVVDGDTIWVDASSGNTEVRLQGVAAPEDPREPGGKEATAYMRQICEGEQVRCELDGSKTRGREVGICHVEGNDIGAKVIAAGLARDCPRFSKGRYQNLEQSQARHLAFPGYCSPR